MFCFKQAFDCFALFSEFLWAFLVAGAAALLYAHKLSVAELVCPEDALINF
jgi:hypothetical protein